MNDQRVPPHSEEAERGLLGAIILDYERVMDACLDRHVKPDWFYIPAHGVIYGAMLELSAKLRPIDIATTTEILRVTNRLDAIGGYTYLERLVDGTPAASHFGYYLDIVAAKHTLRRLIQCAREIEASAFDGSEDAEALRAEAEYMFANVVERGAHDLVTAETALEDFTARIITAMSAGCAGIPTGFSFFDKYLGGLMQCALIYLSGAAKSGKTTLARNICENLALRTTPVPSLFFSLEQPAELIYGAMAAREARISLHRLLIGHARQEDVDRIRAAASQVTRRAVIVDDRPQTPSTLWSRTRQAIRKHGVQFVVIDYLQKIRPDKEYKSDEARITDFSATVTAIAKDLRIPVLCISSLSHEGKLRGSRAMEYDHWGHVQIEKQDQKTEAGHYMFRVSLDGQRFGPQFEPSSIFMIPDENRFAEDDGTLELPPEFRGEPIDEPRSDLF